jgi:hypothetical protein
MYIEFMHCPLCERETYERARPSQEGPAYFFCASCGLVWLDPAARLCGEAERARYLLHDNAENSQYLDYLSSLALLVEPYLAAFSRGLDFGCGPVQGMKRLLEPKGFVIDSYDPFFFNHEELLKNRYDFLLCSEVVEHFFSPAKEFQTIDTLLKSGGILGVRSELLPPMGDFFSWYYRRDPTHVVFYGEACLRWLSERFGWELLLLDAPFWIFRKL